MPSTLRDLMTPSPTTLQASDPAVDAARAMRQHDIGDVVVLDGNRLCGIVTDRDLVVRGVAEGRDLTATTVGDLCSRDLATVDVDSAPEEAVQAMRAQSVRRLPVVEGARPVGIVSLGDLAVDRDSRSALADISSAPANT